ncbi:4-amino-4-deoxy-L-arabinose transferase-like glycosyltransferase [Rhizomicrobium palustre]|uniref:4-amino-4-deoxy-L-arabinose transferase-like glycosyltransferase n=1 Tax=Rhizomicrobium palustre TaxID=189966 RepID=A0A846MW92_9PROT|nr:glycosyltransferase family 39 protein [Rhizomicrobium palustre]NIK87257.1 4-amino-4-deoxy-L-arabinose transferase-like glycosyltransferase [Rhizomicrobium palustre]
MTAERILAALKLRPRLFLTLFCLLLWAPGVFSLPPLDRDESRFAQASKQMLETGDLIDIRFGAVPRYKKPVGIYWMQSASTAIAGLGERTHIWTYRLPSLFGALIAVFLTFWCARAFAGVETAMLAAGFLGSTLLLTAEATIATTDAVLLAATLGSVAVLMRVYLASKGEAVMPSRWIILAGWFSLGVIILVKGPPVFVPLAIAAGLSLWDKNGRWLKATNPLSGIALVLVMVLPWLLAITFKSHGAFFQQSLGQDFATKLQGGQESHGAPPGYFLIALTPSFWPAILFLLPGFVMAIRYHRQPVMRFLLAWTATWIAFELVPTKLPHYVLPTYPALAIMAALWAEAPRAEGGIWGRIAIYAAPVQFALGAIALAIGLVYLPIKYGTGPIYWLVLPALLFAAITIGALIQYFRENTRNAALLALAAPLLLYPTLTGFAGPNLSQLWVSPRAAAEVARLSRPGDSPPKLAGYLEPSLVFFLGTKTRQTDGRGAAEAGAAEGGLALVEDHEGAAFKARLGELEATAAEVGALDGFNYSRGRKVHIRIYRLEPVSEIPPPPAE